MGAGAEGTVTLKGIGQLMDPLEEQLHPGKGCQNIPEGGKMSWKILTTTTHHLGILTGIMWGALLMTPPLPGHADRM